MKVGMVLIAPANDGGWGSVGLSGLKKIEKQCHLAVEYLDRVPKAHWEHAFQVLVDRGCTLILGHGGELSQAILDVSQRNSRVMFACMNGSFTGANLAALEAKDEQLGFMAGSLAGLMSQTRKVGFVGGIPIAPTMRHARGYEAGALAQGIDVSKFFLNDFSSVDLARQASLEQINGGADILYYYLNEAYRGVLEACREKRCHAIASVVSQYAAMPDVVYASALQHMDEFYRLVTEWMRQGQLEGKRYRIGLEVSQVQKLSDLHQIPLEVIQMLGDIQDKLISGEIMIE